MVQIILLPVLAALIYWLIRMERKRQKKNLLYGTSMLAEKSVARAYNRWKKMTNRMEDRVAKMGLGMGERAAGAALAPPSPFPPPGPPPNQPLITAQQIMSQSIQAASLSAEQINESLQAVLQSNNMLALGGVGAQASDESEPALGTMRYFNGVMQVYTGGANPAWVQASPGAAILQSSGQFSSTIKTSQSVQSTKEPAWEEPEKPDIAVRPSEDPLPRILDFGHGGRQERKSSSS